MIKAFVSVQLALTALAGYLATQLLVLRRARSERGSVTIEQVLWAVAVITIVVIVVTAIKTFVEDKSRDIQAPNP